MYFMFVFVYVAKFVVFTADVLEVKYGRKLLSQSQILLAALRPIRKSDRHTNPSIYKTDGDFSNGFINLVK